MDVDISPEPAKRSNGNEEIDNHVLLLALTNNVNVRKNIRR